MKKFKEVKNNLLAQIKEPSSLYSDDYFTEMEDEFEPFSAYDAPKDLTRVLEAEMGYKEGGIQEYSSLDGVVQGSFFAGIVFSCAILADHFKVSQRDLVSFLHDYECMTEAEKELGIAECLKKYLET